MDYKTWSRYEAVPLSNGIITRRTGFDYLKPPEEINAYYKEHFGSYWFNELPKTDNVYSPTSQYYGCTLAPGVPLIPNLCRRPLRSVDGGGYDYSITTARTVTYEGREWCETNNKINNMLDNGHSGHNTRLNSLNLPLPRRRIEFNDSGLDSDSEYETYDNHTDYSKEQSRGDNHVTWLSWIVTVVTTIVTTVVTTVTETLRLRGEKHYNHVDTRVPLKQSSVAVSWYQYPVLWLYKAALAVHRADVWLLWKINSLLQVDRWGTSQQRRKWALILLLIPIIIWAAYKTYEWLAGDETSLLDAATAWVFAPFILAWDFLTTFALLSASWVSAVFYDVFGWFDGSWISYPWIALAGWWEKSGDSSVSEEAIEEAWDVDWSGASSWALWPFESIAAMVSSLGGYLGSAASAWGEGAVIMYSAVVSFLSAVMFWIVDFVTEIPAVVTTVLAVVVSPLKSLSWPAASPTPDFTPSAPPYESQYYQPSAPPPLPPSSAANLDAVLGDQAVLATLVRQLLATAEFQQALEGRRASEEGKVQQAVAAAMARVDEVKEELNEKIIQEESTVESKMDSLKRQIDALQAALNAHKTLVSEQANLGSKLEEKLSSEQFKLNEDQVILNLKQQILMEITKIREEMLVEVKNLHVNQIVTETANGSPSPIPPSTDLEALINTTVERYLEIYDADKIAKVDYALASSGGSVLSVRCTETFSLKNAQYQMWGLPLWSKSGNDPKVALEPGIVPGQCWAFSGNQGYLIVELSDNVTVTGFTVEHLPRSLSPTGTIDTAPRDFRVLGLESEQDDMPILLGRFTYLDNGKSLQYFDALEVDHSFKIVELVIESNHGNLEYTCLYRFRVHGKPQRTPCMYRSFYNS